MMNWKSLLTGFLFVSLFGTMVLSAQDCDPYFITEKGAIRELTSYNKKDKLTGRTRQKVLDIKENDDGMSITVEVSSYDKKDELTFSEDMTMTCRNGVFTVDMKNYLNYNMMAGLEEVTVNIEATDLEMPSDLNQGTELKDGYIHVAASNMGIPVINMEVRIFDRTVEGKETITTPAGTFDCIKLSYQTEVRTIGKYVAKSIEWFAVDIGPVRMESYDKNNNLTGYTVLTELK
jgi:hypothetical protein